MPSGQAPKVTAIQSWIPGQTAGTDADEVIGRAPFAGRVTRCSLTPEAAVTGATATKRTFTLVNKGTAGTGTAVLATLDLVTGTDLVAFDEKDFTLASDASVAQGDVLAVVETHASTGTAHSGGQVVVEITRD